MRAGRFLITGIAALCLCLAAAAGCGDDGGDGAEESPSPASSDPAPTATNGGEVLLVPPFEDGPRGIYPSERTDYWEHPDYQLPEAESLPLPPDDGGPEFSPPDTPICPLGWLAYRRPAEGFRICYPEEWTVEGEGYVTPPADDRWYAAAIYINEGAGHNSHVSVYVTGRYSQPFLYVAQCGQAYQVKINGEPASVCPDYDGDTGEVRIIAYHLRLDERDYFINVVPKYDYDPASGTYSTSWSQEDEETAIAIAHTFELLSPSARSAP